MVRIAAAAVLAFAVSAMALAGEGASFAQAAALRSRDDAEATPDAGETPDADQVRPADTTEDLKNWMAAIAEAAGQLQKMAEAVSKGESQPSA